MFRNCPKCGKVFHYINSPVCDGCIKEDQDVFEKARQHLKENPGISLIRLAKETDIDTKRILRYIRDGKLELMNPEIECEKCKAKIISGRFCQECVEKMGKRAFEAVAKIKAEKVEAKPKPQERTPERMHTDRRRS
ncbi:MAG: hypothetical protein FWG63_03505 [Defluviitaleaceae bacterium]|nr:hypothetical protein [Defluviitaleaceae bacterium]